MDVNHRPELVLLLGSHWMIWIAILQPSALVRRIVFIFYLFPWICGLLPCPLFVHRHSHIHALQWPAWQRWEGTRLRILSTSFLQICLQNTSEVFKQQMCIRGANITYLSLFILCKVVYLLSISIYIYYITLYKFISLDSHNVTHSNISHDERMHILHWHDPHARLAGCKSVDEAPSRILTSLPTFTMSHDEVLVFPDPFNPVRNSWNLSNNFSPKFVQGESWEATCSLEDLMMLPLLLSPAEL